MIDIIDSSDQKLFGIIQSDFPIVERPFLELGERIGMNEKLIIETIRKLIYVGAIRVFGPVFNPRKLGYTTTLAAAEVENERVAELAAMMLEINEITHNYLRDHALNLWFTITARDDEIMDGILKKVYKAPGVKRILNLPMLDIYKISAVFGADTVKPSKIKKTDLKIESVNNQEIALIKALQDDFPIVDKPFLAISNKANIKESEAMDMVRRWIDNGIIRRFGARINHRQAGWTVNILAAWRGGKIETLGRMFAELPEVSHCYRRTTHHDWPYELYTMLHASTNSEMKNLTAKMKKMANNSKPVFMKTLYELKKTSMKYYLEKPESTDQHVDKFTS